MSEWFKVQLSKSCVLNGTVGSNPMSSVTCPDALHRDLNLTLTRRYITHSANKGNRNMKNSLTQNFLWKTFLFFDGLVILFVLVVCITKSENHLPISKMILLPTLFHLFFLLIYLCKCKLTICSESISFLSEKLPSIYMFCYGIALYCLSIYGRSEPIHDQAALYQGALFFAKLSESAPWEYFARCNNNIMPSIILGILFRIGSFGNTCDPFYFAALINVLQIIITMYFLFKLISKRGSLFYAWVGILLFSLYILPQAAHCMSLYTDAMSFCFGIVGFYLWEKYISADNSLPFLSKTLLLGILFGLAAIIKVTAIIPLVAIAGYTIIMKNPKAFHITICTLLISILFFLLCGRLTTLLPSENLRDMYGTPKWSYWIGIGLQGNGGYSDNQDYATHLNTLYGIAEKEAWSKQYIKDNLLQFVDKHHIVSKLRYNFANGALGSGTFVQMTDPNNIFYKLMHYDGDSFWRYSLIMTGVMYFVYSCIFLAIISNFYKAGPIDSTLVVSLLSIFGISLYVMIFEANNRQLFNHLPWFILAATCGLSDFYSNLFTNK